MREWQGPKPLCGIRRCSGWQNETPFRPRVEGVKKPAGLAAVAVLLMSASGMGAPGQASEAESVQAPEAKPAAAEATPPPRRGPRQPNTAFAGGSPDHGVQGHGRHHFPQGR